MPRMGETGVYEGHPNNLTINFDGRFVNLSALSRSIRVHRSHISRIFAGKKEPSLRLIRAMASELNMDPGEFMNCLDRHLCAKSQTLTPAA